MSCFGYMSFERGSGFRDCLVPQAWGKWGRVQVGNLLYGLFGGDRESVGFGQEVLVELHSIERVLFLNISTRLLRDRTFELRSLTQSGHIVVA